LFLVSIETKGRESRLQSRLTFVFLTGNAPWKSDLSPASTGRAAIRAISGWRSRAKPCSIGAIDSHRAADRHVLSDHERRFLLTRRVGHLATADSRAIPHVLPVCFTISQGTLYITIDEKPKRVAGPALKRVRNIERNPMVAIVVDRYDEDWTRLGWVMLRGRAEILRAGTEHDRAQELLRHRQVND
jgi:PPOX class probable F420-dependent enzyme